MHGKEKKNSTYYSFQYVQHQGKLYSKNYTIILTLRLTARNAVFFIFVVSKLFRLSALVFILSYVSLPIALSQKVIPSLGFEWSIWTSSIFNSFLRATIHFLLQNEYTCSTVSLWVNISPKKNFILYKREQPAQPTGAEQALLGGGALVVPMVRWILVFRISRALVSLMVRWLIWWCAG